MSELFLQVQANHVLDAIEEFKRLGRKRFLGRYGFDRSSKYYLRHGDQIYDSKSLLAAAYFHARHRRLSNERFGGGAQTINALKRIMKNDDAFESSHIFEDKLGELSFLADEYHQLSAPYAPIRDLGFSRWIQLSEYPSINTGFLPGVYILGHRISSMGRLDKLDNRVVCIGETASQNLRKRLYQLNRSLGNKSGHSGGSTLHRLNVHPAQLSFSIRSFTLSFETDREKAEAQRSSRIRYLERKLLYEYVTSNDRYPIANRR